MKKCVRVVAVIAVALLMPTIMFAQNGGFADEIRFAYQLCDMKYLQTILLILIFSINATAQLVVKVIDGESKLELI